MDTTIDPRAFDPGPLAEVTAHQDGDRWTVVFVRDLKHPPAAVWTALTDPEQLARWAPYTAGRNLGATGPATLTMLDADGPGELPPAEVTRADPHVLLEYDWGGDRLRWELAPTAGGTRLRLSHTVASRDLVSKVAAGWHLCILVADRLLDGAPIGPIRGQDAMNYGWGDLEAAYADEL
ncbi:MAG TPA: SRPBCC family protein [Solirubrobacteraceae bacterium]